MKKILLLFLTMVGMVSTASASIKIYFTPNSDFAAASATFKLNQHNKSSDTWKAVSFSLVSGTTNVYEASYDNDTYNEFQILRCNPSNGDTWNGTTTYWSPSSSVYLIMHGEKYGDINYYTCYESSYLPTNIYFMSNVDGTWKAKGIMTKTDGVYSYTFNSSTYNSKHFACAPGYAFKDDGTVMDGTDGLLINAWSNLINRPTTANGGETNFDIDFCSYSGSTTAESNDKVWYVSSSNNEASITYNFTPSTSSFSISCTKTTTIGSAGYATWSNGEMYEIDGTNVDDVYVVTANNTDYVTLTSKKGSTFPAGTGVIIKGSGTVNINAVASDAVASTIGTNYLVGNGNSASTPTAGDGIYVFWWDGTNSSSIGFYKAENDRADLAAHKAYLDISGAGAREFLGFGFDNEATGISEVSNKRNDGVIYNLQGQRNNMLKKGINIVNGKKVFVK